MFARHISHILRIALQPEYMLKTIQETHCKNRLETGCNIAYPCAKSIRGPVMPETIIAKCERSGLRMTEQRRVIAAVLEDAHDHPDVEELYARASTIDTAWHQ